MCICAGLKPYETGDEHPQQSAPSPANRASATLPTTTALVQQSSFNLEDKFGRSLLVLFIHTRVKKVIIYDTISTFKYISQESMVLLPWIFPLVLQ